MVAASGDAPEDRDALVAKLGLSYPVLSDRGLQLAAAFGVRQADEETPLPATFVLDAKGQVAWRMVAGEIPERPTIEQLLAALGQLGDGPR